MKKSKPCTFEVSKGIAETPAALLAECLGNALQRFETIHQRVANITIKATTANENVAEDLLEFIDERPVGIEAKAGDILFGGQARIDFLEILGHSTRDRKHFENFSRTDILCTLALPAPPELSAVGDRKRPYVKIPRAASYEPRIVENVFLDPRRNRPAQDENESRDF